MKSGMFLKTVGLCVVSQAASGGCIRSGLAGSRLGCVGRSLQMPIECMDPRSARLEVKVGHPCYRVWTNCVEWVLVRRSCPIGGW